MATINLADGVRVVANQPSIPRAEVSPPTPGRISVVPVRGPAGATGTTGAAGGGTVDLTAHVNSPTPHPAYDDIPDMSLLLENGML